jgi:hypothetical protein
MYVNSPAPVWLWVKLSLYQELFWGIKRGERIKLI